MLTMSTNDPPLHWVDGHLDLAYLALRGRNLCEPVPAGQAGCVSLPALRDSGVTVAFATIFTEPITGEARAGEPETYAANDPNAAEHAGMLQLREYERLESQSHVRIVRSPDELLEDDSRIKLVLLMEGADPIRRPEDVRQWFERGLRIVGLTWAAGTRYCGGNHCGPGQGGLTTLGREMVAALDEAGIIHDASHLSDAAFEDVLPLAKGPVIASHSNARGLLEDRQRHLRDDQIQRIVERGGIIGLNLYSKFLAIGRRATIADCVGHIEHIVRVSGSRACVGLGSDMDGGFGPDQLPEGVDSPQRLGALAQALRDRRWSEADVRGFAGHNWCNFLRQHLPSS